MIPGAFQNIFGVSELYLNVDGHCTADIFKWQLIENSK